VITEASLLQPACILVTCIPHDDYLGRSSSMRTANAASRPRAFENPYICEAEKRIYEIPFVAALKPCAALRSSRLFARLMRVCLVRPPTEPLT